MKKNLLLAVITIVASNLYGNPKESTISLENQMNSFLDSQNLILELHTYYSYVCTARVSRGGIYHASFSASSNISASDACYKALYYIASQPQLAEGDNGYGNELIIQE